jgi:hypothetical protein
VAKKSRPFFTATNREKALKAFYPTRDADYQAQIEAHRSVLINEQNNK